jgi:hypothetical protein
MMLVDRGLSVAVLPERLSRGVPGRSGSYKLDRLFD